jgi:hypothetical protein
MRCSFAIISWVSTGSPPASPIAAGIVAIFRIGFEAVVVCCSFRLVVECWSGNITLTWKYGHFYTLPFPFRLVEVRRGVRMRK